MSYNLSLNLAGFRPESIPIKCLYPVTNVSHSHCLALCALTKIPVIALTAAAPEAIKSRVCELLGLSEPAVISQTLLSKSKGLSMNAYTHAVVHAGTVSSYDQLQWLKKSQERILRWSSWCLEA